MKDKIVKWMIDFVEKPHPLLSNWAPCPYARKARVDNRIDILESSYATIESDIESNLSRLDDLDVIVFYFDESECSSIELGIRVQEINAKLMVRDYVILEDHPADEELVNGVKMNFGEGVLVLLQRLSKLNDASSKLKAQGYYDHWDTHALNTVVTWRNQ